MTADPQLGHTVDARLEAKTAELEAVASGAVAPSTPVQSPEEAVLARAAEVLEEAKSVEARVEAKVRQYSDKLDRVVAQTLYDVDGSAHVDGVSVDASLSAAAQMAGAFMAATGVRVITPALADQIVGNLYELSAALLRRFAAEEAKLGNENKNEVDHAG